MEDINDYYKEMTIKLSKSINSKIKIYLDTKYWVDICDVTLNKKDCKDIEKIYLYLRKGVKENRLICPISYRIFKEILTQSDNKSLTQTVKIIDELSQGSILREERERLSLELYNFFYDILNVETDEKARENYWDFIANIMGYAMPKLLTLSSKDNLLMQKEWLKLIKQIRLKDMLNTKLKDNLFRFRDMKIDTNIYDLNKHLHSTKHNTFQKMYLSELGGTIEAYQKNIHNIFKDVVDYKAKKNSVTIPTVDTTDSQRIRNMIYHAFRKGKMNLYLPSLDIKAMLHAKLRWNKTQKYKQGDFDDIGHATSALPYYDYFFTERSLYNMIKECKYDEKYNCKIAWKKSDVLSFLINS
ncbi:hypothetical protein KKC13_11985 [bacterium]|nr:hypothetical protein [bacterium]MBU1958678.1 hypothetical protein [bacterium]